MEIGGSQRRVRAVVDPGREARWNVERATHADHEMDEVAANTAAALVRVERGSSPMAGSDLELRPILDPAADGLHALISRFHGAEFLARYCEQPVRLAIVAWV